MPPRHLLPQPRVFIDPDIHQPPPLTYAYAASYTPGAFGTEFPREVRIFPRRDWYSTSFGYPDFEPGEHRLKAQWAGREASKKWEEGLQNHSVAHLDDIDLAVAVLDKAEEINNFIRRVQAARNVFLEDIQTWTRITDIVIRYAFERAILFLDRYFPNDVARFEGKYLFVYNEFARPALNTFWLTEVDCRGLQPPQPVRFDEERFTDRYLPRPGDPLLALRPFTLVDSDDEDDEDGPPVVQWLTYDLRPCDPPTTGGEGESTSLPSQSVANDQSPHARQTSVEDPSGIPTSSARKRKNKAKKLRKSQNK